MKVFIWESVSAVSSNYHSEGGLVVFAETEERAREIANAESDIELEDKEMPNSIREVVGGDEAVFTFPDAGCC